MLPKGARLDRAAFPQVSSGKRLVSRHFSVSYVPTGGRAAVVVSKKVAASSVARHTLKRRIMEAVREYIHPSRSFIVYARAGSPSLPYQELHAELATLLSSLKSV